VKVSLLTREYPPEVYGGAGVHVEYLARELASLVDLSVHCWGADRDAAGVHAYRPWEALRGPADYSGALEAISVDLAMVAGSDGADLVHAHTWYADLAGHLAKLVHGIPHVVTVHSLEPMRPWKEEQLGGGYRVSTFCEQTALEAADAIIAVSGEMAKDVVACYPAIDPARLHVVHNGIDTEEYRRDPGTDALERHGVDAAAPSVVFVGRITRQKGLAYLLQAAEQIDPRAQLVLCAGAPDTPELAAETGAAVERLQATRGRVVWIEQMLAKPEVIQFLSHATVFVCPSIYEPLGIVNLEAMACEAPVVATATGGIPEVVEDGVTGLLVPFEPLDDGTRRPRDEPAFVDGLAAAVNELLADPARAEAYGRAGRRRAVERFGWRAIAEETVALYRTLVGG
jgi:starch synthase